MTKDGEREGKPISLTAQIKMFAAANGYKMVPALSASFYSDPARMSVEAIAAAMAKRTEECPGETVEVRGMTGRLCLECGATILHGDGTHYRVPLPEHR